MYSWYFVDTYTIIGLALATSPTDSSVLAAKKWYYNYRNSVEFSSLYWLKMMIETEPNNSEISKVATSLLNLQMPDGGWRWDYQDDHSTFEITAGTLYVLGRLQFTGARIDTGIQWIEKHINSLWEGFSEEKAVGITDIALDGLQAANINDDANLNAINTGRSSIINNQNSNGSWSNLPRLAGSGSYTVLTAESIFSIKNKLSSTSEQLAVNAGSNFLTSQQLQDGGWSYILGVSISGLNETENVLIGLLQVGLTPTSRTISRGLSYLNAKQSVDGGFGNTEQTAYASIIYKLAGAAYQGKLAQTITWLKANQNPDGGWGSMLGYTSTTENTSWALIAFSYAGESGIEVAKGAFWLLAAQNEDTGWGAIIGVPMSNDSSTAMSVWALSLAKYSLGFNLGAVTGKHNYCPGEIVKITATPDVQVQDITTSGSVSLQEGTSYPLNFTAAENAFNAEFTVPSNALPGTSTVQVIGTATYGYGLATTKFFVNNCTALKPDLSISEADLSNEAEDAQKPDSRVIYATVKNSGDVDAKDVTVKFYVGSPYTGSLIGSVSIPYIPVSETYTVNIPVTITEDTYISVVADPDNVIAEADETNNTASMLLTRTIPDLSISSSDITIIPPVIEGQSAVITAIVHNTGNLGASDVVVSFYDGDPQSGGTLIGSVTKSYMDAGATALAEVAWNTFGQSGTNYIHVVVDPQNIINESNENNNTTLIPIDVTPSIKPDLVITSSDIIFSNLNPQDGEPLVITATVHNFGTDASDIKVNLYNGNPSSGGTLLNTYTISQIIPFGGQTQVLFTLDTVGLSGSHEFHIVLDPDNTIDETNEINNTAWNSLTIGPSGVSLGVASDKTSYNSNEDVKITVNAGNLTGTDMTGTIEVRITDLSSNVGIYSFKPVCRLGTRDERPKLFK